MNSDEFDFATVGKWVALLVFIGCWIYCIATYGFLLGVGVGWLPSLIIAVISFFIWPLYALILLLGVGALLVLYIFNR